MSDNTEKSQKQLTVGELIEVLKAFPLDALVWHEGCDCWGKANGVEDASDSKEIVPPE